MGDISVARGNQDMLQSATTTDAAAAAAATLLEHELSAKQQYYSRDKVAKLDLHE